MALGRGSIAAVRDELANINVCMGLFSTLTQEVEAKMRSSVDFEIYSHSTERGLELDDGLRQLVSIAIDEIKPEVDNLCGEIETFLSEQEVNNRG